MSLVSLALMFGSGALMGRSFGSYMEPGQPVVIRPVFEQQPQSWLANELVSPAALEQAGQILDIDLSKYANAVATGFVRVVAITEPGAPLKRQMVAIFEATAPYRWELSEAFLSGYRKVTSDRNYSRIERVLDVFNTDPADEALDELESIKSPAKRQEYLHTLMRDGDLVRLLRTDPRWAELTGMPALPEPVADAEELMYALPVID